MKLFSTLLIIFGILWCLIGGYYFWLKNSPDRLSFQNYKQTETIVLDSKQEKNQISPKRILIDDLDIDVALIPAKVVDEKWETTTEGASYLSTSPIPGQTGNSIIYGHNWASLLGNLTKAKANQKIIVEYSDKSQKIFTIKSTAEVSPTKSDVLDPSNDKRITLYTCSGFLDSKRFVVVAVLDETPAFSDVSPQ